MPSANKQLEELAIMPHKAFYPEYAPEPLQTHLLCLLVERRAVSAAYTKALRTLNIVADKLSAPLPFEDRLFYANRVFQCGSDALA